MEIINETIKKVAEIKANAAKYAAERVVLNDIVFEEGIQPGEVKLESGAEELSALLGCTLREGYADFRGDYAYRVRWFVFKGVHFFEDRLMRADELPEGAGAAESREELYKMG